MTTSEAIILFASRQENLTFDKKTLPQSLGGSVSLAISRMVRDGVLRRVERGQYALSDGVKPIFVIQSDEYMLRIGQMMADELPYADYCVWNPEILVPYMVHVPDIRMHIIEIERVAMDSLFDRLNAFDSENRVLVNLTEEEYGRYCSGHQCVIIKPLVSQSPTLLQNSVRIPSVEKILVDIAIGSPELNFARGGELHNIYRGMWKTFEINEKAMLRYAGRRSRRNEIERLLETVRND